MAFRFLCSLQTPTVLRVFSEGFAGADNYRCYCVGSLTSSPTTLCLVNELFKNHVMGVFKSSLELGKKSGSTVRRRGGNDNACPLYCQVVLRYKPADVNSCPQDTWSQRSWGEEGQAGRGWKRWSELFSRSVIEEQKGDVTASLLASGAFHTPWQGGYEWREPAGLWGAAAGQFLVII